MRNLAYDMGWKESRGYDIPVLCVGNLSVGGTGKSPMIEYLIDFLRKDYQVAVLSRGYKRKTKGYLEVKVAHTAEEVGDEPLQFKQKFPGITVAVCADRRTGIDQLKGKAEIVLLDDAFQHRKVKPSFHILLTPYHDLYMDDLILPAGNLRESARGIKRADIVIVTKCPNNISYAEQQEIIFRMNLRPQQKVYFSKIGYDAKIHGKTEALPLEYLSGKKFTLVTGIANPKPLVAYLKDRELVFTHEKFPDHHNFTASEIEKLRTNELILTTEKDYMRLQPKLDKFALYHLPITTIILNEQGRYLQKVVREAIERKKNS